MATVQLRRYQVKPGQMDEFVEWWPRVVPAREQYGFQVLFAFVDNSTNQFVWAVTHAGDSADFDAAEKIYLASPERAVVFEGVPTRIDETFITKVDVVHQIWPAS